MLLLSTNPVLSLWRLYWFALCPRVGCHRLCPVFSCPHSYSVCVDIFHFETMWTSFIKGLLIDISFHRVWINHSTFLLLPILLRGSVRRASSAGHHQYLNQSVNLWSTDPCTCEDPRVINSHGPSTDIEKVNKISTSTEHRYTHIYKYIDIPFWLYHKSNITIVDYQFHII